MTVKKDFYLREVAGIHVVVALGAENRRFRGILRLNDSAAFLFGLFSQGCEPREAARALMARYGVDQSDADAAAASFVADLERYGLFEHVA